MNNVQLLFYSSLTSTLVLGTFSYLKSGSSILNIFSKENILAGIKLGFLNPFMYYIVLFKAYTLLKAQEALALNFTWPIAISIFSWLFLKQHIGRRLFAGMLLAFIGVIIISTHGDVFSFSFESPLGIILALITSIFWAAYWVMNLTDKRNYFEKLFSAFFYGTILITVYILLFDSFIIDEPISLIGAVYIGLFEMGITFILWLKGLELSPNKTKSSTLAYLSPFLSFGFIALVLGEELLISSIIGLFLIITGIVIQHLRIRKPIFKNRN